MSAPGAPAIGAGPVPAPVVDRARAATGPQWTARFPPRPEAPSWPSTRALRTRMLARLLTAPFALDNAGSQQRRRLGVLTVVGWLQAQPGDTWQQRWMESGAEAAVDWRDLVAGRAPGRAAQLSPGLLVLICGDVIRPSLDWLARFSPARRGLAEELGRARDPEMWLSRHECGCPASMKG